MSFKNSHRRLVLPTTIVVGLISLNTTLAVITYFKSGSEIFGALISPVTLFRVAYFAVDAGLYVGILAATIIMIGTAVLAQRLPPLARNFAIALAAPLAVALAVWAENGLQTNRVERQAAEMGLTVKYQASLWQSIMFASDTARFPHIHGFACKDGVSYRWSYRSGAWVVRYPFSWENDPTECPISS